MKLLEELYAIWFTTPLFEKFRAVDDNTENTY